MEDKETLVMSAKLAEQMERYEDMVDKMKKVAEMGDELSVDDRNLLSVAYKNVIGTRRMSWRTIASIEQSSSKKETIQEYRHTIEDELKEICEAVKSLLDLYLIPKASDNESKVFYYKMKGDYCRYQAEFLLGDERDKIAEESKEAYGKAQEVANDLDCHSPLRLGLALNFSVFYYEIMNSPSMACEIAEKASSDARSFQPNEEDSFRDSSLIVQLLRDNLALWKQADEDDVIQD